MSEIKLDCSTIHNSIPLKINNALIDKYKQHLTSQEQIVLCIAEEHLKSSFDITKSIGFIKWLKLQ
jgi:hypothetical protein